MVQIELTWGIEWVSWGDSGGQWERMEGAEGGLELLTGSFPRNLDNKYRFALPKPIREVLGEAQCTVLYMAPGTDGSLVLYTEQSFLKLGEQLERGSPTAQDIRTFGRLFYAQAHRVEIDSHGRVRIPAHLGSLLSADKEIMLIGVRDHMEIWGRSQWEAYLCEKQPFYDEIAERAFRAPKPPQ